jgi:hypothetical protein
LGSPRWFLRWEFCPEPFSLGQPATGTPLKIGIIGSGNLGGALGTLWVKSGHPVLFSSRHPEQLKGLVDGLGPLARAGTVGEALAFGGLRSHRPPHGEFPRFRNSGNVRCNVSVV